MSVHRGIRRKLASLAQAVGGRHFAMLALGLGAASLAGVALAQGLSDQQIRCMQLQQDLSSSGGGGASRDDIAQIDQQIAQADRVFQGTQAAMDSAGCYQRLFIFGRALVRSPQCLKMNDRVEGARRQLSQLQQQRNAMTGGGGAKRRQAEIQQALARAGCGGPVRPPKRGGLFDFFGGGNDDEQQQQPEYQTPVYRNIDPNGRYRTVCVRLCDGFYYPISYATYGARVGQDADRCQANCAAPAELYVYRNPGQEIEQAISLQGSAYMDLPVALKFRKEYVKGCSCKQAEYNPTEIEQASKHAEAEAAAAKVKPKKGAAPAPQAAAATPAGTEASQPADAADGGPMPKLDLDITGSTATVAIEPPKPQAANPPAPPAPAAPPAPPAAAQGENAGSTVVKKIAPPPPPQ